MESHSFQTQVCDRKIPTPKIAVLKLNVMFGRKVSL